MSVQNSKLIRSSMDMTTDDRGRNTYAVEYEVISDSEEDSPASILSQAQGVGPYVIPGVHTDYVPEQGDHYTFDSGATVDYGAFAQQFRVWKPNGEALPADWRVRVSYAPPRRHPTGKFSSTQANLQATSPLNWPIEYWMESVEEQVEVTVANNLTDLIHLGRQYNTTGPIINTAGEQISTPRMQTRFRSVLVALKNFASPFDIWWVNSNFQNTMNSDQVTIPAGSYAVGLSFAKYTLRFLDCRAQSPEQAVGTSGSSVTFYPAQVRLEYSKETWDWEVNNDGFKQLVDDPTDPIAVPILAACMMQPVDNNGQPIGERIPVTEPAFLDEFGRQLPQDQPPTSVKYRDLQPVTYKGSGTAGLGIGLT